MQEQKATQKAIKLEKRHKVSAPPRVARPLLGREQREGLARQSFEMDIRAPLSLGSGGVGVKPPGAIGCRDLGDGHAQALLKP